jgi:hypothetical protein
MEKMHSNHSHSQGKFMEQHGPELKMAGGAGLAGLSAYTLNEWVMILTIVYLVFQIGLLMPKYSKAVVGVYMTVRGHITGFFDGFSIPKKRKGKRG